MEIINVNQSKFPLRQFRAKPQFDEFDIDI